MLGYFLEQYGGRSALLVLLLALSGIAEGFGLLTLLPLLELVVEGAPADSLPERVVLGVTAALGIEPTLGSLLLVVVGALWLKGLFRWLAMRQVGDTVARVSRDLRLRLMRALLRARWGHSAMERSGEIATALSRDAVWASHAYRDAVGVAAASIQLLVYATVVVLLSWRFGAFALAGAAGLAVALGMFVRMSRRAGADQTRLARSLVNRLLDVVGGMKVIKAMGREGAYLSVLERHTDSLERAERRQVLAVESLHAFQEPLLALVLAPLVYLALTGTDVSFATLALGIFLFHRLMSRSHQVQAQYQGMVAAEAAFTAVDHQTAAAEAEREPVATGRLPRLDRELEVRDVTVTHGGRSVLDSISLILPARRMTALVGASGVGKTTLLDLILGLREPDDGRMLVDGVPLEQLDSAAWRRRIGYVPQEPVLLADTIARNVALGDDAPDAAIDRALRRAGAASFIAALPEGIHARVGERGIRLSGGERQRIAIARALLHDPLLLVLDEPTSELDAALEAEICATLRDLRDEVTVITASHRGPLVDAADRRYELADGRVLEQSAP